MNPSNFSSISFPFLGIEVNPGRTLSLGPLTIHYYGLVIAVGLMLAVLYACRRCRETGRCVFDDCVNAFTEKAKEADGFIFGSPVYYAHPSGRLLTFMDRAFYSCGSAFMFKPGAAVLSARRAGTTASFDVINKYFTICSMPVVSSTYWNHVYGAQPEQVQEDPEGLQTMTNLGRNMAWLLKCIALGKEHGIPAPENPKVLTNFVR